MSVRVELTEERREALEVVISHCAGYGNAKAVLRAMLEEGTVRGAVKAMAAQDSAVQRLRAVEGELRPTTNRTTQAKVMISQYSEDWHKWADEIAAVADSLDN